MPPKRSGRSVSRKDNPSSPPKTRDDATSTRQTRGKAQTLSQVAPDSSPRQQRRQKATLNAVSRDSTADNAAVVAPRDKHDDLARDSSENGTDPNSEVSGEASFSSAGSDEFDALIVGDIVANLPTIDSDAQQVLNLIKPESIEQLAQDVQESGSIASKRLRNAQSRLRQSIEPCAPRQLIDIKMIVRRIGGFGRHDDLPSKSKRRNPDPIFAKANLALFWSRLVCLSMQSDSMEILETLFHLISVDTFPDPFGFDNTSSELPATTVDVALDILTQAYIAGAHVRSADQSFDPEESLAELFDATPDEPSLLNHSVEEGLLKARQNEIRLHCASRKHKLDLGKLRRHFPWEQFVERVSAWTKQIVIHLNKQINTQGGAETIADKLESGGFDATPSPELTRSPKRKSRSSEEIRRQYEDLEYHFAEAERANAPEVDQASDEVDDDDVEIQETVPSPSRRINRQAEVGESPNAVTPNRNRKGRSYEPLTEVPREDVPTVGSDGYGRGERRTDLPRELSADGEDDSLIPTQATADILAVEARQERESNKENIPQKKSLLDRQEGAIREEWHSQGPSSDVKGKRRRDETDEDDFQDDIRQKTPRRSEHRPPKPDSLFVPEDSSESGAAAQLPTSSQTARTRPTTLDRASLPTSTGPQAAVYDKVKSLARTNTNYLKSVAPLPSHMAPSQSRRAWTAAEVECLIEMIAKHGCKWSLILQADKNSANPQLQGRNQVQLKDKARNMKLDYLKAEMPLPENFAAVTISRSHKEELDRLGLQRGREGRFEDEFVIED